MVRFPTPILWAALGLSVALAPTSTAAQDAESSGEAAPPPARFRIVLNGAFWPGGGPSFSETRRIEEYAEETTIQSSFETESAFGPDVAVQVRLFRALGIRVGYSLVSRDQSGTVEVSRPHPLHFDRPRTASAELSGLTYSERALHLDVAFGRSAGHLAWSLFGGVTLFSVEADLPGDLTYDDVYPYDELGIASTPSLTAEASPTGFNVGGGLDYRFGRSGTFGLGLQILYSTGDGDLEAGSDRETVSVKAGGLQAAAGVRIFF